MPLAGQMKSELQKIVNGGASAPGYIFANPKSPIVRALERDGYVQSNASLKNPSDAQQVAYSATQKGLDEFPSQAPAPQPEASQEAATAAPVAVEALPSKPDRKPSVAPIVHHTPGLRLNLALLPKDSVAQAAKAGHRGRTETYPFSSLAAPDETGQDSFFVAQTEAMPKPERVLASTVNRAHKKYPDRKFQIVPMACDPEKQLPGARVFRVK